MPWFKIDDGFHCHPKVFAAGTAAVGLYVRCGSWAAQQSSEGIIPKQVARLYGTPRMIKALIDAGLWHGKGHDCDSCPELDTNSYVIHQYLERNPSRNDIESARKSKSERQQRWRESKRNMQVDGPQQADVDADVDASHRHHGDAAPIPSHPNPSSSTSYGGTSSSPPSSGETLPAVRSGAEADGEPAAVRQLMTAMASQSMNVAWKLSADERQELAAQIERVGVHALVEHAARAWQNAKNPPYSARYFLPGWLTLQPAPAGPPTGLHALGGPSKAAAYLEDMAAIAAELRQTRQNGQNGQST